MNSHGAMLSQGFIRELFLGQFKSQQDPIAQILNFQISEVNKNQITLRISDGETFIDCPLVGLYRIHENRIVSSQPNSIVNTFQKFDLIRVSDMFHKIQEGLICPLKIMIRNIIEVGHLNEQIGKPQEIAQYIFNNHLRESVSPQIRNMNYASNISNSYNGNHMNGTSADDSRTIKIEDTEDDNQTMSMPQYSHMGMSNGHSMVGSVHNGMLSNGVSSPYGHMQGMDNSLQSMNYPLQHIQNGSFKYEMNIAKEQRDPETPLSLREIYQETEGFFIGRLLRMKAAIKETKDGQMTVLFLGFVDRNGEMVRINVAGRIALKEQKTLKKGVCYYIKGLQLIKNKHTSPQIRLKDKEYKIHRIDNEEITSQYATEYFHWDHEIDHVQYENVDVIGIVDEIEEKTSYKQSATNDQRDVVRVIIRNKYKTVKVSFWADQIKHLQSFELRLKQPIILEDIKKKKSFFLDFTFESSIVKLEENPGLLEKFEDLIPSAQDRPEPENIEELKMIYQEEPSNTKIRTLRVYILRINEGRIIYKLCESCKKKVDRHVLACKDCGTNGFAFKFNCQVEFADSTGSITATVYDLTAHRLFEKSAAEISEMSQKEVDELIESFEFRQFLIGFENKKDKAVVRNAEPIDSEQTVKLALDNLRKIRKLNAEVKAEL